MPIDLVLVRHGQSEANAIQKLNKADPLFQVPVEFSKRHNSQMRLSMQGRIEASRTGVWLRSEFPHPFDRQYVSALVRTIETAGILALDGDWVIDDRWRERDRGEYGVLSIEDQEATYEGSTRIKGQTKWYWSPPGGESLATGVRLRFEDILETLHRELSEAAVLAVTHGEMMGVARLVLERLTPEEWQEQEKGADHDLANCQVLHYSRRDPDSGELSPRLEWRRSICAWDPNKSWNDERWVHIARRQYRSADLLALAAIYPNLLT